MKLVVISIFVFTPWGARRRYFLLKLAAESRMRCAGVPRVINILCDTALVYG